MRERKASSTKLVTTRRMELKCQLAPCSAKPCSSKILQHRFSLTLHRMCPSRAAPPKWMLRTSSIWRCKTLKSLLISHYRLSLTRWLQIKVRGGPRKISPTCLERLSRISRTQLTAKRKKVESNLCKLTKMWNAWILHSICKHCRSQTSQKSSRKWP